MNIIRFFLCSLLLTQISICEQQGDTKNNTKQTIKKPQEKLPDAGIQKKSRIPITQPSHPLAPNAKFIHIPDDKLIKAAVSKDENGKQIYKTIPDLNTYLEKLKADGHTNAPLVLVVYPDIRFDRLLEIFDACSTAGFKRVTTRLKEEKEKK